MELNQLIDFAANSGFPIVITFYLLFRMEKVINMNTSTIARCIEIQNKVLTILETSKKFK